MQTAILNSAAIGNAASALIVLYFMQTVTASSTPKAATSFMRHEPRAPRFQRRIRHGHASIGFQVERHCVDELGICVNDDVALPHGLENRIDPNDLDVNAKPVSARRVALMPMVAVKMHADVEMPRLDAAKRGGFALRIDDLDDAVRQVDAAVGPSSAIAVQ